MHASTGPDIKVVPGNLPLAPCGFARHANIARVCGTHAGDQARHEHPTQDFAMTCRRKTTWTLCRIKYALSVFVDLDQQIFTKGKNRRRSVPESSLTEEAAIPPDAYPFIELLVERDMPVLIHCDQPIFGLPRGIEEPIASRAGGGGSSLPSGTRMSISLSSTSLPRQQDRASKLLSRKVD